MLKSTSWAFSSRIDETALSSMLANDTPYSRIMIRRAINGALVVVFQQPHKGDEISIRPTHSKEPGLLIKTHAACPRANVPKPAIAAHFSAILWIRHVSGRHGRFSVYIAKFS